MCRNTAQFFCKDTRVPICTVDCKKKHFEESQAASVACQVFFKEQIEHPCFEDARQIVKQFCKFSMGEVPKERILALELLHHLVENFGIVFLARKELLQLLRSELMESILHNAVDEDRPIYSLAYSIFVDLVVSS
jgi:brefeldin A-inhibited guanine nucleotide-exchange protein